MFDKAQRGCMNFGKCLPLCKPRDEDGAPKVWIAAVNGPMTVRGANKVYDIKSVPREECNNVVHLRV